MKVSIVRGLVVAGSLFVLGMLAISPRTTAFAQDAGAGAGGMGGCCGQQPAAPTTDSNGCQGTPRCGKGTIQKNCMCVAAPAGQGQ